MGDGVLFEELCLASVCGSYCDDYSAVFIVVGLRRMIGPFF